MDLNGDTAIDLVFGSMYRDSASARPDASAYYVKNQNPQGWPFEAAKPVQLEVGRRPCFYDVDRDGRLDSVCLIHDQRAKRLSVSSRMGWRRNQGGDPPRFGAAKVLEEIDLAHCYFTAAVRGDSGQGVIVSYDAWQRAAFLEQKQKATASTTGRPRFVVSDIMSHSAELALGDQATPFPAIGTTTGIGISWLVADMAMCEFSSIPGQTRVRSLKQYVPYWHMVSQLSST